MGTMTAPKTKRRRRRRQRSRPLYVRDPRPSVVHTIGKWIIALILSPLFLAIGLGIAFLMVWAVTAIF